MAQPEETFGFLPTLAVATTVTTTWSLFVLCVVGWCSKKMQCLVCFHAKQKCVSRSLILHFSTCAHVLSTRAVPKCSRPLDHACSTTTSKMTNSVLVLAICSATRKTTQMQCTPNCQSTCLPVASCFQRTVPVQQCNFESKEPFAAVAIGGGFSLWVSCRCPQHWLPI